MANGRYKINPGDNGRVIPSVTLVSSSHIVGKLFSNTGKYIKETRYN